MYLFQLKYPILCHTNSRNLHSTMYLFQHNLILHKIRVIFIYIPLCIYFNVLLLHSYMDVVTFTFHYVSISTRLHPEQPRYRTMIYIPLCIYFNQCPKELRADTTGIYIPLCIYFNGFLPEDVFNVIMIYIPLCIYFN